MSSDRVMIRKGLPCTFTVEVADGIGAQYTEAKFQVRSGFDDELPLLLGVTDADGIIITPGTPGTVLVEIGATKTDLLPKSNPDFVAELRLYNPADDDDRLGWKIPVGFDSELIDDD